MFSQRDKNVGILFTGDYAEGEKINYHIDDGDSVILKIGAESILVRNISLQGDKFKGKIYGFEPSFSEEYEGLAVGQTIEFSEENIISCGKKS